MNITLGPSTYFERISTSCVLLKVPPEPTAGARAKYRLLISKICGTQLWQRQASYKCKPDSSMYFDTVQLEKSNDWRRCVICLSKS